MSMIISFFILSFAVWLAATVLPGIKVRRFWDAVVVSLIFSVIHLVLGWLLFVVIGIATLGLGFLLFFITRLFVSAILLKLTDALTDKLEIRSFGWALAGALVIAGVSGLAERLLHISPGLPWL